MKKFAVFDIDGTFFRWQLYSELVFELIEKGHIPAETRATLEAKMERWQRREHSQSFRDYELEIVNAFFTFLKQLKMSDVEAAADAIMEKSGRHVYTYTRSLIKELKAKGYTLIAISGSHDEVIQRFAKLWEFDIALGQAHETKDERYTGEIPGKLLILQKGELLKKIVAENNLSWKESVAVGDSQSDAGMLELVEHPIAFNPNDELFKIAKDNGWKVVIERKNMCYELEIQNGTYVLAKANSR